MSRRITKCHQRIKLLQILLCLLAFYRLRFINNHDRICFCNNINRTTRTELIEFHIDTSRIFSTSIKCLRVDNHYINRGARRKAVNFSKLSRIVNKEANLLTILFCKMLLSYLKWLIYTFTYSYARYNNNELAPTISTVKLIHSFYVCICFTNTGLHFDSQIKSSFQLHRRLNLICSLYCLNMFQNQSIV